MFLYVVLLVLYFGFFFEFVFVDGWLFNIDFILIYEMFRNIMDILMDVFFLYEFVVGMNG